MKILHWFVIQSVMFYGVSAMSLLLLHLCSCWLSVMFYGVSAMSLLLLHLCSCWLCGIWFVCCVEPLGNAIWWPLHCGCEEPFYWAVALFQWPTVSVSWCWYLVTMRGIGCLYVVIILKLPTEVVVGLRSPSKDNIWGMIISGNKREDYQIINVPFCSLLCVFSYLSLVVITV